MNGTPVVFGVGVLKGPFLPNVHSVSSLLLSVPVSASVASSPSVCPFPAVGGNLSFGEQHSVSFAQERRLMVPVMYFHSECVFVKG